MKTSTNSLGIDIHKDYIFLINRKSHRGPEVAFTIPSVDEIIEPVLDENGKVKVDSNGNPEEYRTRGIRYVKGQRSIYIDEQPKELKNGRPIKATDRVLKVAGTELTLLEYLLKCNFNGSNKNRKKESSTLFELYEPEKQAAKAIEDDESLINAQYRALHMPIEQLKPLLLSMCTTQSDINKVAAMEINELRLRARGIIKKDPKKFLLALDSEDSRIRYRITSALSQGAIKVVDSTNSICWLDGNPILQAPHGRNPIDHFVHLVKTEARFAEALNQIDGAAKTKEPVLEPIREVTSTNYIDTFIAQCVDKGLIIKNGFWYKLDDKGYKIADLRAHLQENSMTKFLELQAKL